MVAEVKNRAYWYEERRECCHDLQVGFDADLNGARSGDDKAEAVCLEIRDGGKEGGLCGMWFMVAACLQARSGSSL
ncbi:hypothetical protein D5086_011448 [Populus alba]|uniref:Uncharacterized protein n=1 Tax=Populus alba TaxID=43335 RepID=A0ACC4CCA7_POPAL